MFLKPLAHLAWNKPLRQAYHIKYACDPTMIGFVLIILSDPKYSGPFILTFISLSLGQPLLQRQRNEMGRYMHSKFVYFPYTQGDKII